MDNQNNNVSGGYSMDSTKNKNILMGVLAYLGILVVVPFIVAKGDSFVKFHIKQGLVLLAIEIIVWILGRFLSPLWMLLSLVNLGVLVLAIIGIINVVQGKEKELPLVGSYSRYFNF